MGVATQDRSLTRVTLFASGQPDQNVILTRNDDGTGRLSGIRVLRTGTFVDANYIEMTFTLEHLSQMVFHFNLLRDTGRLPNIPWRANHTRDVNSVVGYITALRVEGDFLIADVDLTEPDAVDRWERGTYRARSAEVGFYETNDNAFYWPVLLGVAFVDIPAVEGLYSKSLPSHKENNVDPIQYALACGYAQALEDTAAATEWANAAFYAQGMQDGRTAALAAADKPPAPFLIGGTQVHDYALVQDRITAMEAELAANREKAREDFVKGLASDGKIMATQVETLTALAKGFTDDQFEQFKKGYEGAPSLSLLSVHGDEGDPNANAPEHKQDDELKIAEETVAQLRRAGLSAEQIEKSPSFQKLQALQKSA